MWPDPEADRSAHSDSFECAVIVGAWLSREDVKSWKSWACNAFDDPTPSMSHLHLQSMLGVEAGAHQ
jgi:hypothetical protein